MPRGNSELYRAANLFKVPKKEWAKWTLVGKHTFNKVYSMMSQQDLIKHTEATPVPDTHWKVIAWNAAFLAASITSRGEKYILKDLSNKVKG